jgi:hypothetical protein
VATIFVLLTGVGIGVAAYEAGERNGIEQGIAQVETAQADGDGVQVVYVDEGRPFFFPGFFLFPLFFIGTFFLIGALFRGGPWRGHHGHGGPWNEEGRRRFEERAREWHSKEHGQAPPAPAS